MASYGGNRGGGGRGRGRGRGGGRGGGGNYGGGGGGGGGRSSNKLEARLLPCKSWTTTGACPNSNCNFAHVVKLHASIEASSLMPQDTNRNYQPHHQHQQQQQARFHAVSSLAIWETQGAIKIFSGSHDGFWRLWNTQGSKFAKEFEHDMGGKVECLEVAANFLFCGFESVTPFLPDVRVGRIHCWNLASPADPPLEFHMQPNQIPYAHATAVTKILVVAEQVISGSRDGCIRLWRFDPAAGGGKGQFLLTRTLHGHAREITGLVLVDKLLWSCSTDGSIRLWDIAQTGDCQYTITNQDSASNPHNNPAAVGALNQPNGHHNMPQNGSNANSSSTSNAFTGLLTFPSPAGVFVLGSSLNGLIKAWNGATGECVAQESHGEGVVSMALAADPKGHPLLLVGLERGDIIVRNVLQTPQTPAFCLLFKLTNYYSAGHEGPVKAVREGPACTFYTGGGDGKLLVWQFTNDLGI